MYNALQLYFTQRLSETVGKALEAKIAEKWQYYIDNPTPRWAEVVINKPGITGIEKVVFGIGTHFHVSRPSDHFALNEHALSQIKIPLVKGDAKFRIITDPQGGAILNFDGHGYTVSCGPVPVKPRSPNA